MDALKETFASHHILEPAKKVKHQKSSWHVIKNTAQKTIGHVGTTIGSIKYLFVNSAADAQTVRESQDYIRTGQKLSNFGIEQYTGGILPENTPFQAFAQYAEVPPPQMVPQAALSFELNNHMERLSASTGAKMTAVKVTPDVFDPEALLVMLNAINSQTLRDFANGPNLVNAIIRESKYGKITIRCGIYDDPVKAAQFLAIVKQALQKGETVPENVRIAAHNLCSYGVAKESSQKGKSDTKVTKLMGEADLIVGQQTQIHHLEVEIDAWLKKQISPQIGIHFTSFEPTGKILGDSTDSHERNIDGTATYIRWLQKSFYSENPPAFLTTKKGQPLYVARQLDHERNRLIRAEKKLLACLKRDKRKMRIPELEAQVERHKQTIRDKTDELKNSLHMLTTMLQELSQVSDEEDPQKVIATKLVAHYLTIQLGQYDESWPAMTRAQELALSFLIDYVLDVITQLNCKSGVDRTGLAAAIFYALEQMIERDLDAGKTRAQALEHAYNFLLSFLDNVHAMDVAIKQDHGSDKAIDLDAWLESEVGQPFKETVNFQRDIFAYVMGISEPLEFHSSGFRGLKWKLNRMMFDWLPSFIHDTASGNWIRLTTPSTSTPNQRKLTNEGHQLFIGPAYERNG
ncbi:MAG: hypothetical protein Q8K75_03475 [Chlamydiales bacterium]|nr:hypothetical protein [Chlamydiales bacterium]